MSHDKLKEILKLVKDGECSIEDGIEALQYQPFEDIGVAKVDTHRSLRKGFPEVVFGLGKTPDMIVKIVAVLQERADNILVTRTTQEVYQQLSAEFEGFEYNDTAAMVYRHRDTKVTGLGTIAVITAGSTDIPVAEEAAITCAVMGNEVERCYDVGVAGMHRLLAHKSLLSSATVCIVVAGMEGALPSVVGGLVASPVIAVPTSIGYGTSLGGISALLAMLNSCSSGITVVNIDNGYGAGYAASLINHVSRK